MAREDRLARRAERSSDRAERARSKGREGKAERKEARAEKREGKLGRHQDKLADKELFKEQGRFGQISRGELRKDVEAMQAGELGLSQAEKRQMIQGATEAAGTQMGKQQELAARQSLGGVKGTSLSPEEIAETSAEMSAKASAGADLASKELAENRRKEIIARVNRQQDINRAMTQHYLDWGIETALDLTGISKVADAAGGGGGGGGGGDAAAGEGMAQEALSLFGG